MRVERDAAQERHALEARLAAVEAGRARERALSSPEQGDVRPHELSARTGSLPAASCDMARDMDETLEIVRSWLPPRQGPAGSEAASSAAAAVGVVARLAASPDEKVQDDGVVVEEAGLTAVKEQAAALVGEVRGQLKRLTGIVIE